MRHLTNYDKQIIRSIQECLESKIQIDLQVFLQSLLFKAGSGRALILQSPSKCASFYLTPEKFHDIEDRKIEIKKLFDFYSLIENLQQEGYIAVYREKLEQMYFLQEEFTHTSAVKNYIFLNEMGMYTSTPETILSKDQEIVYQGIVFNGEVFEYMLRNGTGFLLQLKNFENLLTEYYVEPKRKISFNSTVNLTGLIVGIIGVIMHTAVVFYVQKKAGGIEKKISTIITQHNSVKKSESNVLKQPLISEDNEISEREQPTRIYGIDISKWNGSIASKLNLHDSIKFVICKATEGRKEIDKEYLDNWSIITQKNLITGVYHFYHDDSEPQKQALHYWKTIANQKLPDITLIVDIEEKSLSDQSNRDLLEKNFIIFLNTLQDLSGKLPMIYTDTSFANKYLTNPILSKYPLWLACYTNKSSPKVPMTWAKVGYKIWQKRDNYFIDSEITDFDIFSGLLSELKQ